MTSGALEVDAPWLAQRALMEGDAPAVVAGGDVISFAELAAQSDRVARALRNLGVERGSRVAALVVPSCSFAALLFAIQRLGAALVPLGLRLTAREIVMQLVAVTPALLVVDRACEPAAREAIRLDPRCANLEIVCIDDVDLLPTWTGRLPHEIDPDAALTMLFTSGTESLPKAVISTNLNHRASACAVAEHLKITRDDSWLCPLPLSHIGGLSILLRGALAGFRVVLQPSFDAARVAESLSRGDATLISLVPTMLARVLDSAAGGTSRKLRAVVSGGAALPYALARRARDVGYCVVSTYGLSETASQVTATELGDHGAATQTSGRPFVGVEIRIDDADDEGVGEILVRAQQVMAGYWGNSAATAAALRNGWLHTGDAGRLTADGLLVVADRRADLIVTGGENVAPAAVEAVLLEHPLVADAGVYGTADPLWGASVCAAVVVKHGETLDAASLSQWCRERMARFKVPRVFTILETLPRTASGKLRRAELARSLTRDQGTSP